MASPVLTRFAPNPFIFSSCEGRVDIPRPWVLVLRTQVGLLTCKGLHILGPQSQETCPEFG